MEKEAGKGGKEESIDKRVVSRCALYLYPACASSSASVLNSSYIFLREIQHDWCVVCVCVCGEEGRTTLTC